MSEPRGQELWDRSASAWIAFTERGDFNRTVLLDPLLLRLAGNVGGLDVCDVGCGEGRFSRMLAERGARITGIEPTRSLLEEARRRHPEGRYLESGAENMPLPSDAFDLVVSYLVLIDIEDYRAAVREMARIVRPGGRVLVANMNSFCTTRPYPWVRDEEGNPVHVAVDDYFRERGDVVSWAGIEIVNYHRPLESYMQAFLDEGLRLTDFAEPKPTMDQLAGYPTKMDALRVPLFLVTQWRKE